MDLQIKEQLYDYGIEIENDTVLGGLVELADELHKTSTELIDNFQVFRFNNKMVHEDTLTASMLELFKSQLKRDQAKENIRNKQNLGFNEDFDSFQVEPKTPATKIFQQSDILTPTPKSVVYTPASNFAKRQKKGEVLEVINGGLIPTIDAGRQQNNSGSKIISILSENVEDGKFRYMINGLQKQLDTINDRIERFAEEWINRKEIEVVVPVNTATLEDVGFVGRICCDGEGRLNEASILLEGSIDLSNGQRVKLNVSNTQQYRLFPGQIVGIIGNNPTGKEIFAKQIKEYMFPKCGYSDKLSVVKEDIKIFVCAGPYTTQQDLAFEPLDELLNHCGSQAPNLLILMGPFLDENHPLVDSSELEVSFEELFQQQVIQKLQNFLEDHSETKIAIIPSCKDVFHHPVYPTPPFSSDFFRSSSGIKLLPDPCVFAYGGVSIAVSSLDILRSLCKVQIQKGYNVMDTMLFTSAHIIGQATFYPLVPAELDQNVDMSLSSQYQLLKSPDFLLLASDLQPFVRQLSIEDNKKVTCINSGRLCKGQSGTFTEILISQQEIQNGKQLQDSCKVEIKRI